MADAQRAHKQSRLAAARDPIEDVVPYPVLGLRTGGGPHNTILCELQGHMKSTWPSDEPAAMAARISRISKRKNTLTDAPNTIPNTSTSTYTLDVHLHFNRLLCFIHSSYRNETTFKPACRKNKALMNTFFLYPQSH